MTTLNPRVDFAFKKIFGAEENKDLLISFINSVILEKDPIVEVTLLNPYNSVNFKGDKGSILDIKAKDSKGIYYDIEMQVSDEGDYDKRALNYWAETYTGQIGAGQDYSLLRKTIGIHILNFNCIPETPKYNNKFIIKEADSGIHFFQDFVIYTIELEKFIKGTDENLNLLLPHIKTGLDRWSTFLTKAPNLDRNNLPKELSDDPCIKKALNVLNTLSLNKEEREIYEEHLKWLRLETSTIKKVEEKAKAEGLAEGKAAGEANKAKTMALEMLLDNEPEAKIVKYTGLSLTEIAELKK